MMMKQVAQQDEAPVTSMEEALVIGGGADNWIIQSGTGTYKARKAFSCLVAPEIGDRVLSVLLPSGNSSILAILERKQSQTTRLRFDGDVDISSSRSIRMFASKSLDACSGDAMNFDSKEFSLRSKMVSLLFDRLNATGSEANQNINKVKILTKSIETVSETSRQVTRYAFRLVSGLESVNAGEVLQSIKKRFTVQSRQLNMLAEEDANLNAKRVHLG